MTGKGILKLLRHREREIISFMKTKKMSLFRKKGPGSQARNPQCTSSQKETQAKSLVQRGVN